MSNSNASARFFALVPAAGAGARLGAPTPKQYLPLLGQPMLLHTLRKLASHSRLAKVFVVISPADVVYGAMPSNSVLEKCVALKCGGQTRAQSVMNGLKAMNAEAQDDDWVLVHDAARPCISHAVLDRLIDTLQFDDVGGIAAVAVSDTLKKADSEQRIAGTTARDGLWQAQTPQMFRYGVLLRALQVADIDQLTDEASAIERLGLKPRLVEGDPANIKVTYERDIALAESILRGMSA